MSMWAQMFDFTHLHSWHGLFIRVMCLIHVHACAVCKCLCEHKCVWHGSFMCMPCHIQMLVEVCTNVHVSSNVCYDSFTCVTWLIHMCGMSHSRACVWSIQMSIRAHMCETWLFHMCGITCLIHTNHATHVKEPCLTSIQMSIRAHMCGLIHTNACRVFQCLCAQSWCMCIVIICICIICVYIRRSINFAHLDIWILHIHSCEWEMPYICKSKSHTGVLT